MEEKKPKTRKGLLIVNTGDGKGKTTAALGMAMRAAGHGMKVCFIQFIKGTWKYGEMDAIKRFEGLIELHVMGKGFTWKSNDIEQDMAAARQAWDFARQTIKGGQYDMVVLDEFTYLLAYGMIDDESAIAALSDRPAGLHLVITGRGASRELRAAADLVTDMRPVKHPFDNGINAQKGIEF